jgi:hypothetical protein
VAQATVPTAAGTPGRPRPQPGTRNCSRALSGGRDQLAFSTSPGGPRRQTAPRFAPRLSPCAFSPVSPSRCSPRPSP